MLTLVLTRPFTEPKIQDFAPEPTALVRLDLVITAIAETPSLQKVGSRVVAEILRSPEYLLVECFLRSFVHDSSSSREELDDEVGILTFFFPNDPGFAWLAALHIRDVKEIRAFEVLVAHAMDAVV